MKIFFLIDRYIEDLMNGTYLQQTVESVIGNEIGKQLMVGNDVVIIFSEFDRLG